MPASFAKGTHHQGAPDSFNPQEFWDFTFRTLHRARRAMGNNEIASAYAAHLESQGRIAPKTHKRKWSVNELCCCKCTKTVILKRELKMIRGKNVLPANWTQKTQKHTSRTASGRGEAGRLDSAAERSPPDFPRVARRRQAAWRSPAAGRAAKCARPRCDEGSIGARSQAGLEGRQCVM